jgi:Transposase DDE domain
MLARHRENDALAVEPDLATKHAQRITRLQTDAAQLRDWLAVHPIDRMGSKGSIRKSNRTDNESAKMATSKGVIQGYCGVAAVDDRHQIVMEAQAHGTGSEQALLMPIVDALAPHLLDSSLITADAGYHSAENLKQLADKGVAALIADNGMRQRDERFADQAKHKQAPHPLHNKHSTAINTVKANRRYKPTDFSYDKEAGTCICPAGKQLYQNGQNCIHNSYIAVKFQGAQQDCLPCEQRDKCLRHPDKTKTRQVSFFRGKADTSIQSLADKMKQAIDSERGRALYGGRFATVEPVFGNIRHNKRLNRFTLRGQQKVDGQWKLFCLVHNIEKLAHHGYAQ